MPVSRLAAPAAILSVLWLAGCAGTAGHAPPSGPLSVPAARFPGMDTCHRTVTTLSPLAQEWFDQGLSFFWGFNHGEAMRSFNEAARLDPDCAMAWWGVAASAAVDLNDSSMTEEDYRLGMHASERAVAASAGGPPAEAALARAMAARFAWPPPEDRRALDEAYCEAMGAVFAEYPDDPDIATLYADSIMLLEPWDYWNPDGTPKGRIFEAVAALETALDTEPTHAGASHFLVHALEASDDPGRAEDAADVLVTRVPGSGHLVHMPSHIYVSVGRYADGSDVNTQAVLVDRAYIESAADPGFYYLYFGHNLHMLAFCAMMEGREAVAMQAARDLEAEIPEEFILQAPGWVDGLMSTPLHVMVRFGRWDEILAEPDVSEVRLLSRAQRHYARGVALSALGRTAEARAEQVAFEQAAALVPEDWKVGSNPAQQVLGLARQMLLGELLWREGDREAAFAALAEGARLEDEMVYDEPPGWMQPVRHAWGALLMADGQAVEAEAIYRADLARHPGNGWSLLGLREALLAQDRTGEAAVVDGDLTRAWFRSDIEPASSCFCEPGVALP